MSRTEELPESSRRTSGTFGHRFGGVLILWIVFVTFAVLVRIALLVRIRHELTPDPSLIAAWVIGLGFDLLAAGLVTVPFVLYLIAIPQRWFAARAHRFLMQASLGAATFAIVFSATAEWFFWDELGVRFNFIAVDYLVYTWEVIGNIWESYPLPGILTVQILVTIGIVVLARRAGWMNAWLSSHTPMKWRLAGGMLAAGIPLVLLSFVEQSDIPDFTNERHREMSKNGVFSFFAAWQSKALDYHRFYPTVGDDRAIARAKELIATPNTEFRSADPFDFVHTVRNQGPEKRYNVIQITVESLSTHFLGAFGDPRGLTPNIDRLAGEGLLFTRTFATGTRTTRGMEALTLSLPPIPGRSILHREVNTNLFTNADVFRSRGYETVFLYSGFGTFDDMNAYFGGNGFRTIDRSSVDRSDITFANVWGACDEDLYRWTIEEADRIHAENRNFYFFVMTTSNHRPFTFPEGTVDHPQGKRTGAVAYTDYAIGRFMETARTRDWLRNTIIVVVADHSASSAGMAEIDVARYRIPMIIWNPELIPKARQIDRLVSQIDLTPTLFSMMNWDWTGTFYGRDILSMTDEDERAFIGNYQKLALFRDGRVAVLRPTGDATFYSANPWGQNLVPLPEPDPELYRDTVAAYQSAYYLYTTGRLARGSIPSQPVKRDGAIDPSPPEPAGTP